MLVILVMLAAILWLVNAKFGSLNPTIKLIINIVVIVVAVILCLQAFGIWEEIKNVEVPKI